MVYSQDKVRQRFVEQIMEDVIIVGTGFNSASWSRISTRGSDVLETFEELHTFSSCSCSLSWPPGDLLRAPCIQEPLAPVLM